MLLVLCEESDLSAVWAAGALQSRGLSPVVVTGERLASAAGWRHTIGNQGVTCDLRLAGGARIDLGRTRAVLNRLPQVPAAHASRIAGPDRDYAYQEIQALYLSLLHALPGVKINSPTPQGLSGNYRHPSAWAKLAVRARLPVRRYRQTSADDPRLAWQGASASHTAFVHVVMGRALGPRELLDQVETSCVRLAADAGVKLLGIEFAKDGETGSWQMVRASVMPELITGGEPLANLLAEALTS